MCILAKQQQQKLAFFGNDFMVQMENP